MDIGANDLLAKYLRALKRLPRASKDAASRKLWRLFAEHSWYQQQLRLCTLHALRLRSAPSEWLDDVQHEAMLIFAKKLRRRPDLRIDPSLAPTAFAAWLRTIITRNCLQAIRGLRRLHRPALELQEEDQTEDDRKMREERIDVSLAMERLGAVDRTALTLYGKGYTRSEIGEHLRVSTATAHRIVEQALHSLQEILVSGGYS